MKKLYALLALFAAFSLNAQVVTTQPSPLQEDSQNVIIYFDASQGNKGLMGVTGSTKIYAHTWAVLSNGQSVGAPNWNGTYPSKFEMVYEGPNSWLLNIGDIRSFYGVTNPNVRVKQLGFVFRDASGNKTGRMADGSDIIVNVLESGLQVQLQSNLPGKMITPYTEQASFTALSTEEADLTISVNGEQIASGSGTSLTATYDFATPGDYTVTATAKSGDNTATDSEQYCYVKASAQAPYPSNGGVPKMGPVKNADGSVTFCLGAPLKHSVMIVGAWNDYALENDQVMNYTDVNDMRYFWITIPGLDNTKQYGYYFIVNGETAVGDPYARLVLDPWNDKYISTSVYPNLPAYPYSKIDQVPLAVYQGNINDYDWQVTDFVGPDPKDLIIYEMLLRDFTGTEGRANGNGTVQKAIEKLPYLIDLGVNCIELLPIMDFSGNVSWGYNPNFYFAPDKAYGTPDDYKEFIDLCHQNGIAVVLDMVFNQSDGLHPWYQMYTPGQNPFYNLNAPHAYSVLNDWNQGYPMVQEQFNDVIRYWMEEYKFDGFRFDLVKGLGDNDSYGSSSEYNTNKYNQSRIDRMIGYNNLIKSINPNAYCINEDLAYASEENAMAQYGMLNWANVNEAACQFAMGYSSDSNMNRLYAPLDDKRLWGSTVSYLESHDEQRLAYKQDMWGVADVKGNTSASMERLGSAAAQMLMAPGAHMIWQFSELGNAQNTKNTDGGNNTDPKIVNWNLLDDPDHYGLYNSYRELIYIRNNNKELFTKDASFSMNCAVANWAKGRTLFLVNGSKELYTVVNPSVGEAITVSVPFINSDNSAYQIMSQSFDSSSMFNAAEQTVTVPANCYVVIGSKSLQDVESPVIDSTTIFQAYGTEGGIVIENAAAGAEVYTVYGMKVAQTADDYATINVNPGLYIVRSGDTSAKVLVR